MLESAYLQYLRRPTDPGTIRQLAKVLEWEGMVAHADLLRQLIFKKPGKKLYNPWTDGKAAIHKIPPADPDMGDIWMDLLDLTPHVYCIPEGPETEWVEGWYPIHPTLTWQYLGFLHHFKYDWVKMPMIAPGQPPNLLSGLGVQMIPEKDPVTCIYYYDAACYAAWAGKDLVGDNLLVVRDIPWNSIILSLAPYGLNLWSSPGYRREDDPMAFNLETAAYMDYDELEYLDLPPEKKVVYDEWEQNEHTGFACMVKKNGLRESGDGFIYPYVKMKNIRDRDRLL